MVATGKSNAERGRAHRIRRKIERGRKVSRADRAFLEKYDEDTTRWQDVDAARAATPPPLAEGSGPIAVPVHTADEVGVDPSRWLAAPTMPPSPSPTPTEEQTADDSGPAAGADDGTSAAQAGAPQQAPPPDDAPIIDDASPQPVAVDALTSGAKRFAGFVWAINAAGLHALKSMINFRELAQSVPPEYLDELALLADPAAHAAFLRFVKDQAFELAMKRQWIAAITPGPEAFVIVPSSLSLTCLYIKWLAPIVHKKKPAQVEPQRAANETPASNANPNPNGNGATSANVPTTPPPDRMAQPLVFAG